MKGQIYCKNIQQSSIWINVWSEWSLVFPKQQKRFSFSLLEGVTLGKQIRAGWALGSRFLVDFSLLQYLGSWLVLMFEGKSFIWRTYHKKKISSSSDWDFAGSAGELEIESESWRHLTSMPPSQVFKWWWFLEPGIWIVSWKCVYWLDFKKVLRKKRKTRSLWLLPTDQWDIMKQPNGVTKVLSGWTCILLLKN